MGSLLPIEHCPSPNHGERLAGKPLDMLILHYTGMNSDERALRWLCDPESAVSSHYFVFEDGRIAQLVEEDRRAWHAGQSCWEGEGDINSRSIGIEIANPGHQFGYRPFPEVQMRAVIDLCRDIVGRHAIPSPRVLAHSDIAPLRKDDPGELFSWYALHAAGVGTWVPPHPLGDPVGLHLGDHGPEVVALIAKFRAYGYCVRSESAFDSEVLAVVQAFQRHFRPARVDGVADISTVKTLERLLREIGRE